MPAPAGAAPRHWAEALARRHLEGLGWTVLEANYAWRGGEIDLIAKDGDTVVFVEVRQRRSAAHGHPAETLDRRKLARLALTARRYLAERPWREDAASRFDAVLVVGDERAPRLTHLRDVLR
ncbi:MAG TPA: YraN family protein [Trueperaceae bacterium]|nr:YraN family protein [Trueperaceae bacterium]